MSTLLAPVKAIFNIDFYREALKKPAKSAIGFTAVLYLFTVIFLAVAAVVLARPIAGNVIDRVAFYTPQITVQNGKITVNEDNPMVITPEELEGYKIYFNTGSTDSVYPTEMERSQTLISVTANTVYMAAPSNFRSFQVPEEANLNISGQDILNAKPAALRFITAIVVAAAALAQLFKIPFMILLGFIVAAVLNGATSAQLKVGEMLKLSCYMQAPATLLYLLNFISPFQIGFMFLVYIIVFAAYAYLAMRAPLRPAEALSDIED